LNIIIIELDKLNYALKKPVEKLTSFEKWSLFFKFAQDPVQRDFINDIIKEKEEIGMAAKLLQEISKDEHERARLRSRRMYETDRISDLLTAEAIGEARGEARSDAKWQNVVADKDIVIACKDEEIARLQGLLQNSSLDSG
jgi:hypothetical protein